jgi:hypothetical protein
MKMSFTPESAIVRVRMNLHFCAPDYAQRMNREIHLNAHGYLPKK